ncbi:MAG: hypothetical protein K6E95_08035 [Lachnospiraceae bacterium]|nr:hypothetical protein [Lachnospiraceae bacterium]
MKLFTKLFSGKELSGKSWVISTLIGFGLIVVFLGAMNFFIDPFSYFRFSDGQFTEFQDTESTYLRYVKAKQIEFSEGKYDAFIVGGSKAGALRPETLNKVDGHNYYNCWILSGNLREYYLYTKFILENTDAKKILLHISGPEVKERDRTTFGDVYQTPAVVTGDSELSEFIEFLGKDISLSWEDFIDKINGDYKITIPGIENGLRNLQYRYDRLAKDPEGYIETAVLHDYDDHLKKLFKVTPKNAAINESLDYMKKIKNLCADADVELQVVIGASFINELYEYEAKTYWAYLVQIVDIFGEVWDFSGFNDVNFNPYNFYNESHYNYEVGDLMINTMANGSPIVEGFGQLIDPNNRYDWMKQRRLDYLKYKKIYLDTNTIDLSAYTYDNRVK